MLIICFIAPIILEANPQSLAARDPERKMALQEQNIEKDEIIIEIEDASSRQSLVPMLIAGLVLGIVGMGVALVLS